jgi:ABC-type phosphate transport system substrate-binding protein
MRLTRKLLAGCGAVALVAVSAAPALADPPKTPRASDVVGVGSDTVGYLLDQLAHDYNKAHPGGSSLLYSWDATNPVTGETGDPIVTKAGCKPIARPDGSSAGITALEANTTDPASPQDFCVDYAGSSRGAGVNDPGCTTGGICFIPIAGDAVTWAARDAASGGTDAPASLTRAQLAAIYECKITNWARVGGRSAPIQAFLPQTASGTRAVWLLALGGGKIPISPGACVSDDGNTLQDNQGINPVLNSPEAIVPYSVADFIAQVYHDAPCTNSSCTGSLCTKPACAAATPACVPTAGENMFGCDEHGVLGLGEIGGSKPITPWPPPPPPCPSCAINQGFARLFLHPVYAVARFAPTPNDIPTYLGPIFDGGKAKPPGYICTAAVAVKHIKAYGFVALPGTGPAPGARSSPLPGCGVPHWNHYRHRD